MLSQAGVETHIENGIATISFFHPQSNAMPASQLQALAQSITAIGQNPNVNVLIIQSQGEKTFCAGASFDELMAIDNPKSGLDFFSGFAHVINAMRTIPQLIIARIQGKAVGGGVGIACSADYTFAHTSAAVKLSELAVGIGPFVVGPAVERKIGVAAFSQLAINATEWQTAEWALQKGMYQELHESIESLNQAVNKLAFTLSKSNPEATKALKTVFWQNTEHWDTLLLQRAQISGSLVTSSFTRQAIQKFKTQR